MGEGEVMLNKAGGGGVILEGVVEGWVVCGGSFKEGRYPVVGVLDGGEYFVCVGAVYRGQAAREICFHIYDEEQSF